MAENLPIEADYATSAAIAKRIAFAIKAEEPTIGYGWPDLSAYARRHAMAWGAVRAGYQMLEELGFGPVGDRGAPEPEKSPHGQEDASESEWASLAKGTLP